ncbi:MAG TPA: hypothetical protein VGX76_19490 [Pirellulales bacterium]|nr:hypothetical protein [Pirellulales bacterium]
MALHSKWANRTLTIVFAFLLVPAGPGCKKNGGIVPTVGGGGEGERYEVEITDYLPPPVAADDVLTDDRIEDKKLPAFDPELVDRRPLEAWLVNSSAAVIRLDVPMVRPDSEAELTRLHGSYAQAVGPDAAARGVLPSVNLLDGKAKQFDDGLYAAIDQAHYRGLEGRLMGHVELVQRLFERAGPNSPAAPFLAAGLALAGVEVDVVDQTTKQRLLDEFNSNEVASKPIGFYTWNETLQDCFRFLRFFQREFDEHHLEVPLALAAALAGDKSLADDDGRAVNFYSKLTNPYTALSVADLVHGEVSSAKRFVALCREKRLRRETVALFPPSTSRETELFGKLFPLGLPPGADLMRELVRKIRSGEVDLRPRPDSGWYDHQVYALETMLLPERGDERDKLLLSKSYKKRMLEAFEALMTKRRETHVRQLDTANAPSAMPRALEKLSPRLRLEPCPSYYLRTARSYAFLVDFLEAALGQETLSALRGLTEGGERPLDLHAESGRMRDLFYGLYLVSADDIGLAPSFAEGELPTDPTERERCFQLAIEWLPQALTDPDLAADTRVSVPVFVDVGRRVTKLWVTLGVRLAKLEATYAVAPRIKPAEGEGDWRDVEAWKLDSSHYLVPVDEFAEVELRGVRTLSREELRAICDREKTKEAIVKALER